MSSHNILPPSHGDGGGRRGSCSVAAAEGSGPVAPRSKAASMLRLTQNVSAPRPIGALLVLIFLAGCGRGTGEVSGEAKYQGKPLAGATITFYDATNKPVSAVVDEQGKYVVKDVAAGPAKIAITMPMPISFEGPLGKSTTTKTAKSNQPALPSKYADPEKSGLSIVVKTGPQTHDIVVD